MPQPCTAIWRRLLHAKSPGVRDILLIVLIMKPPSGFKQANPELVIGKRLVISLLLHSNKAMYKRLSTSASYKICIL